ncbi:MAG: hypothetical protein R6U27_14160 [Desulfobacterales bacterium]
MSNILIITAYAELFLWIAAFHLFFFHKGHSFAESASYALISTLMSFSFIFQFSFIIGIPAASFFFEAIMTVVAVVIIFNLRACFKSFAEIFRFVIARQALAFFALFLVFGYLAFVACSTVPEMGYQNLFNKIKFFEQHKTFFLQADLSAREPLFPMNTAIISHLFLRANSHVGTGLIGFLAYLSVGFSTYALSRRYAWPDTAFTVTFITLSLTRLVFLSTTPGMEIVPAAGSLFCILAIYRSLEQPDILDLILLFLGILFSISAKNMVLAFPVILIILVCLLFIRRHGTVTWRSLLINHWKISLSAVIPLLVFSQAWLFAYNIIEYGGWLGANQVSNIPTEGNVLLGAVANLVRYLFESLQLTWPLDILFSWTFDFSFNGLLFKTYNVIFLPLFATNGAAIPFVFSWAPSGQLSWFGPFGILFVVPAVIVSIFRAHRRLKAIAIALAGYVYIVTLVVAWKPGNAEFFTIVFTCGGFCVSFLLPPWRFTTSGKKFLQVISILLLLYVCIFNANRPLLRLPELFENFPSYQKLESQNSKLIHGDEMSACYRASQKSTI